MRRTGKGALQSPAAAGIFNQIAGLPEWLRTGIALHRPYLPEDFVELAGVRAEVEMFLRMAQHSRTAVLSQQPIPWRDALTAIGLKSLPYPQREPDELRAFQQSAQLGYIFDSLVKYLERNRATVAEGMQRLHDEREAQTNSAPILGTTRRKFTH